MTRGHHVVSHSDFPAPEQSGSWGNLRAELWPGGSGGRGKACSLRDCSGPDTQGAAAHATLHDPVTCVCLLSPEVADEPGDQ